jgi:L-2,4-diaminobutyrate decarboxylase
MLELHRDRAIADRSCPFDRYFLGNSEASQTAYRQAIAASLDVLERYFARLSQPYSGATPAQIADRLAAIDPCPDDPQPIDRVLDRVGEAIVRHSVVVSHPRCIAHLHCPPVIPALAAEAIVAATNQSMDSWDQSPAATIAEVRLIQWLCREFGYSPTADGVFTSGGTQSNYMGLLLSRDRYARDRYNWCVRDRGLPPEAAQFRVLCSKNAHFTVRQGCAQLGLGERSVVTVPCDRDRSMSVDALERAISELGDRDLLPIAIVATAGTTDFGSIDPLIEIAEIARKYKIWLHVDAAFGGALILSDRYRQNLAGINLADSIAVDFHKLFYQPISCGAFLLRDRDRFDLMKLHAAYLNPETNEEEGIPDLVTKSVQTTRRFDALKLWISLEAIGRVTFGQMIDTTLQIARQTAAAIDHQEDLELAHFPSLNTVVFRYLPERGDRADDINNRIRQTLMDRGIAVIAKTQIEDKTYLKFTLLNPQIAIEDLVDLLDTIREIGQACDREMARFSR